MQARADGTVTKGILGTQIGAGSKKIDDFYFELADRVQTLYQALEFTRGIDAGVTDKDFYQFIIEYDNNEDSFFLGNCPLRHKVKMWAFKNKVLKFFQKNDVI